MFANFKHQLSSKLIAVAALLAVLSVVFIITQRGRSGDQLNGDQIMQDEQAARRQEIGIGRQSSSATASKSQTLGNPQLPSSQSSERLPDNQYERPSLAASIPAFILQREILYKVDPVYPEIAKSTGLNGIVELKVTIDKSGAVTGVDVISGEALFAEAAVEAVWQWRYEPSLVDGLPMPFSFDIIIGFTGSNNGTINVRSVEGSPAETNYVNFVSDAPSDTSVVSTPFTSNIHIFSDADNRVYHSVTSDMLPPVIQIDKQGIRDIVTAAIPNDESVKNAFNSPFSFLIWINENGDISRIRPLGSGAIAALEKELPKYLSVQSPTSYNGKTIPSWIQLTIDVPQIIN